MRQKTPPGPARDSCAKKGQHNEESLRFMRADIGGRRDGYSSLPRRKRPRAAATARIPGRSNYVLGPGPHVGNRAGVRPDRGLRLRPGLSRLYRMLRRQLDQIVSVTKLDLSLPVHRGAVLET